MGKEKGRRDGGCGGSEEERERGRVWREGEMRKRREGEREERRKWGKRREGGREEGGRGMYTERKRSDDGRRYLTSTDDCSFAQTIPHFHDDSSPLNTISPHFYRRLLTFTDDTSLLHTIPHFHRLYLTSTDDTSFLQTIPHFHRRYLTSTDDSSPLNTISPHFYTRYLNSRRTAILELTIVLFQRPNE
ncbi:hypothetical protein Pcinc_040260 [Petrolisthes cinctipes]|uniref:Uncharacterized protein n=1 Tax=Petrolisthes cinctipes TaxID=88211 RepID=A0AAE1EIS6_PETCI|nr:hypothetical protein Pcinc_040260 [Petrolisthes cinctipes]